MNALPKAAKARIWAKVGLCFIAAAAGTFGVLHAWAQATICPAAMGPGFTCSADARDLPATVSLTVIGLLLVAAIVTSFWRSLVGNTIWIAAFTALALSGLVGSTITLTASGFQVPPPWPW